MRGAHNRMMFSLWTLFLRLERRGDLEMAERGRFELPVLFRYSRFPGVRVKPLCHLSHRLFLIARLTLAGKANLRSGFLPDLSRSSVSILPSVVLLAEPKKPLVIPI